MAQMPRRFCLGLLLACCGHAQIATFAIENFKLPNGMEVILHMDRKMPLARVHFGWRVGSKDEKPGRTGLAHLFEHLLFQRGGDGADYLADAERLGATDVNGETSADTTTFSETVPAGRLERMLWLESNRFALFLTNLDQQKLDRQRAVVINEKRQRNDDGPYGRVDRLIVENIFPSEHPYHHETGGEYADLRAITLDDAREFYAAHYTPDQATLAIVGDFDPAQVKEWITKYFASMAPGKGVASAPQFVPPLAAPKRVELEDRVSVERAYFAWPAPPVASRESAALELAGFVLNHGPRQLHRVLTDRLSGGVSIAHNQFQDASTFCIFVSLANGAAWTAVEDKVTSELARLAREGPSAADLEWARNSLDIDQTNQLESLSGVSGALLNVRFNYGSIDRWRDWASRYSSVTAEEVRSAVGKWLVGTHHLTVHVRPQTAERGQTAEPDRTQPPPIQPEKRYHVPEVQSATLPNGLQIFVVERHDVAKVAVNLAFRVGSLNAPSGKPAVAALAAATLGKGETRDRKDVEEEFSRLAISLHGSAELTTQALGFEVLRKQLAPAFALLSWCVLRPDAPDWPVDGMKKDWLADLDRPSADIFEFTRPMLKAAFGAEHPFGAASLGTAAGLRSITPQDVRDFRARWWRPNVAALTFAGDITFEEAVATAREAFGSWSGAAPAAPEAPPFSARSGRLFIVDRKGANQTMVAQVATGIPKESADYLPLLLADRVYGGISASRLRLNIRQEKGIAYFAASQLWHYPGTGLWVGFSRVQTDSTGVAVREFQRELRDLAGSKPVTAAELDEAKTSLIRSVPDQFETVGAAAGAVTRNWLTGLPLTDLASFADRIAAVTLDEVNAAARKYAQADRAFFVLIGDRDQIEPQLRDLGLGTATMIQ
jgi:zinc protease